MVSTNAGLSAQEQHPEMITYVISEGMNQDIQLCFPNPAV